MSNGRRVTPGSHVGVDTRRSALSGLAVFGSPPWRPGKGQRGVLVNVALKGKGGGLRQKIFIYKALRCVNASIKFSQRFQRQYENAFYS